VSSDIHAQVSVNSPYSRFGLGILNDPGSIRHFSMGGVCTPLLDGSVINFQNPATYSSLTETVFQLTGKGSFNQIGTGDESVTYRGGNLNEVALGFKKLGSPWAIVIGLTPYSTSGYQLERSQAVNDTLSARYRYAGEGGINRLITGVSRSFEWHTDTAKVMTHKLMFGANINYLFGSVEQSRRVIYNNNQLNNTRVTTAIKVADFFFDLGMHYTLPLAVTKENAKAVSGSYLQLGADYSIGTAINTRFSELGESFYYFTSVEITLDTSYIEDGNRGYFSMPSRLSIGGNYLYHARNGGMLSVAADYRSQDWSDLKGSTNIHSITPTVLRKSETLAFGVEYLPEGLEKANRFFSRVTYRAGVRQSTTYLQLGEDAVMQRGISAGISIPLIASRSASRFHFGIELAESGGNSGNLIEESMTTIQVGFTLHPFERWFFQRKYD